MSRRSVEFQRFVGIDWSGAKGATQSGIQVAEIDALSNTARLKNPSVGRNWGRESVLAYLAQLNDVPTLVGIDFGFSVPWTENGPFEGLSELTDVKALWRFVDSFCASTPHLYAQPIWILDHSPFKHFIYHYATGHRGQKYDRARLRLTETLTESAISVYHMSGVQVGASSFSGMRMLNQLTNNNEKNDIVVWPFDDVEGSKTTIVEIYPSYFYSNKSLNRPKKNDLKMNDFSEVKMALSAYGANFDTSGGCRSVDQADALISAAALKELSRHDGIFNSPTAAQISREGWIFGVPMDLQGRS